MATALQILPTKDYAISEPFGVKGLAELILRNLRASGEVFLDVAYSTANAQKLRKAAAKIAEDCGDTFTFTKEGDSYREVTYAVSRMTKSGKSTAQITRSFLNVDAIRCYSVQNEADAAIAAEADHTA